MIKMNNLRKKLNYKDFC